MLIKDEVKQKYPSNEVCSDFARSNNLLHMIFQERQHTPIKQRDEDGSFLSKEDLLQKIAMLVE
jgi:hypothetical protein